MNTALLVRQSRPRRWKRMLYILVSIVFFFLLFLYVGYCVTLYNAQDSMMFPTFATIKVPVAAPPEGTQVLYRSTDPTNPDVKTEAWYLPAPGASTEHPAPLLVFFHGNAEIIDQEMPIVSALHEMGWSVLLPEFRGYNRSGGKPTQDGLREDAAFFLDMVLAKHEVDSKHVVYAGRSIGGGPAADLVHAHKPSALILLTAFQSASAMASVYHVPSFLVKNTFRTDHVVEHFDGPILICHGNHDQTIDVENSRYLAKIAQHPTYVEFDSDHNDFPGDQTAQDRYRAVCTQFLADVLKSK